MSNETVKHHEFSPSRLSKFAVCPWSYKNCQGWTSPSGSDAERGNAMHRAIYDDEVLEQLSDRDKQIILDIRERNVKPAMGKCQMFFEYYVEVTNDEGEIITAGWIDQLMISLDGETASVIDYKFGSVPVEEAKTNPQIFGYVAGVFRKFPNVKQVFALIDQPIFEVDYDKQAEFHREDLPLLIGKIEGIEDVARNATESDAVINPNCKYCARERCAVYKQKMQENLAILALNDEGKVLSEDDRAMTIEFADRLLMAERQIKSLMETKCEAAKKAILAAGGSVNFKVMPGRVTRRTDWKTLAAEKGITEDEIAQFTTASEGEPYLTPKLRKAKMISGGKK